MAMVRTGSPVAASKPRIVWAPRLATQIRAVHGPTVRAACDGNLVWLQRAADTGFPCTRWFEQDPLLEPVRSQPGFVGLLDHMRASDPRHADH